MMNGRFKEVYEKAHAVNVETLYLVLGVNSASREVETKTFDPEKFAMLIVQEFAAMCDELGDQYSPISEGRSACTKMRRKIQDYFKDSK